MNGLVLNDGAGKTEAILSLRGPGAKGLRQEIEAVGGILTERVLLRIVGADKHLGTLVTPTACPRQEAARRVSQASTAYASLSGHFLSSIKFDLALKMQSTTAFVDATLLFGCKLWAPWAAGAAARVEAVHTRWLRKVTGEFQSVAEVRSSDQDARITCDVLPSAIQEA